MDQNQSYQTQDQPTAGTKINNSNFKNLTQIVAYAVAFLLLVGGVSAYVIRDNQANIQKADDSVKIKTLQDKVAALEKKDYVAGPSLVESPALSEEVGRDTQRKNDLNRLVTAATVYAGNNRGAFPSGISAGSSSWDGLVKNYISNDGDVFTDPLGAEYILSVSSDSLPSVFVQKNPVILITDGATCGDNGEITVGQSSRRITLQMRLEAGGVYCTSNN